VGYYRNPDIERIVWHRVGIVYPKAGQKIMLFFKPTLGTEVPIVLTKYDSFAKWCPRPTRWAKMPSGPFHTKETDLPLAEDEAAAVVAI
jgi:hypothetical protein